jgi:hypothetical protein
MNAKETIQSGLIASADGKRAVATIGELTRKPQQGNCSRDRQVPLVSWERMGEFGNFKTAVRCECEVMNP